MKGREVLKQLHNKWVEETGGGTVFEFQAWIKTKELSKEAEVFLDGMELLLDTVLPKFKQLSFEDIGIFLDGLDFSFQILSTYHSAPKDVKAEMLKNLKVRK